MGIRETEIRDFFCEIGLTKSFVNQGAFNQILKIVNEVLLVQHQPTIFVHVKFLVFIRMNVHLVA